MNARGLMELIVMKVGLDAGLIGKPLFTMLLVSGNRDDGDDRALLNLFAQGQPGKARESPGSLEVAALARSHSRGPLYMRSREKVPPVIRGNRACSRRGRCSLRQRNLRANAGIA